MAPAFAANARYRHERLVVKVTKQVLALRLVTHLAQDDRPDVLAAAVCEVPGILDALPKCEVWPMDEVRAKDVLAVRVNLIPERGVRAVGKPKGFCLVAEHSHLHGCQGDEKAFGFLRLT